MPAIHYAAIAGLVCLSLAAALLDMPGTDMTDPGPSSVPSTIISRPLVQPSTALDLAIPGVFPTSVEPGRPPSSFPDVLSSDTPTGSPAAMPLAALALVSSPLSDGTLDLSLSSPPAPSQNQPFLSPQSLSLPHSVLSAAPMLAAAVPLPVALAPRMLAGLPATTVPGADSSTSIISILSTLTLTETATWFEMSVVTQCNTSATCNCPLIPASPSPSPANGGDGPDTDPDPCPGNGYTCDDCLDGWFCPPSQTPAQVAPCGYGWPCYHCSSGWFCAPRSVITVTECPAVPSSTSLVAPIASMPNNGTTASCNITPASASTGPMPTSSSGTGVAPKGNTPAIHPAQAGWAYAGCYKDDQLRSLKDIQLTGSNMTNANCITYCQSNEYGLAGSEDGDQCFCGNEVVDSWLLPDFRCNMSCAGDASDTCGGAWALSVYSPDGKAPMAVGPEQSFSLAPPAPGVSETSFHSGGVRQIVIPVTTPVLVWPPPTTALTWTPTSMKTPGCGDDNATGLVTIRRH